MALFIIPATHSALTGRWRLIDRMQELQRPIEYREVPEQRNCDRTLSASDQLITALMVGTTGRVLSGQKQRPISSRKAGFVPNDYFLSGAYK